MLKSQVDWRSDIYALGILAYEMVTGESPFKGDSVYATMTKRLKTDPDPPSKLRSDCSAELDRIILKAMQRDPENRYQAAIEMFADLQKLAAQVGIPSVADAGALMMSGQNTSTAPQRGPTVDLAQEIPPAPPQPPPRQPSSQRIGAARSAGSAGGGVGVGAPAAAVSWGASEGAGLTREPAANDILLSDGVGMRQRSGTEVFDSEIVNYEVDPSLNIDPYTAPEPLVSTYPERVPPERGLSLSKGSVFRSSKSKRHSNSSRRGGEGESYVGEIIALGFAAAVGIGCGFMFLKFFAPSLLAKWHF
jgi:serine/threonine protein kinase